MCNTSNALYAALVLSKQTTNCLKLFAVNNDSCREGEDIVVVVTVYGSTISCSNIVTIV